MDGWEQEGDQREADAVIQARNGGHLASMVAVDDEK